MTASAGAAALHVRVGAVASAQPVALYAGIGFILVYLVAPPLFVLVQTSLWVVTGPATGHVGLDNFAAVLRTQDLVELLRNSIVFAVGSSALALVIGGTLAWLVERTNTPLKHLAYVSAFVALAIPGIIRAIGWIFLLGPRNGLFNVWLVDLFGLSSAPLNVYTMQGMILVEGLLWTPAVFLLVSVPLRSMDPSLEEAALVSGATTWRMLRRVTVPLATPAALSVLLLTLVRGLEAFEIPAVIGIPGRVFVLTSEIYTETRRAMFPDYGLASAYALVLVGLVAVGIYYYSRATRAADRFATITGKGYRPRVLDLGRARMLAGAAVLVLPLLIALPFLVLMWASLLPFYSRPSLAGLASLTLKNYSGAFANTSVQHSVTNSVVVGVVAATAAVLIAAIVAWLVIRTSLPGRTILDYLVSAALVLPGVVLGVAIMRTYLTIPIPIYGTIWILAVAYVTRFLPYAMRYTYPGLIQIHRELEESAHVAGAGWATTFRRIVIPLMMPALFGAWIWIFLVSLRELSVAAMLAGPQSQVIASTILDLWDDGQFTEMAAYSVVITTAVMVLALGIRGLSLRWGLHV